METIFDFGCRQIVLATRGSKGACLMIGGKIYEQSPYLINAKDTMGAGDSFIACFLFNYLEEMKMAVDFKESHVPGILLIAEYQDLLMKICLYCAAVFSAEQCLREGSFGFGKPIELTEEDMEILKEY
ncbi:hypothetical protein INP51_12740 [Blautia liquoris]|jgi:sugar/nucleoside kinase (ribokinase family)|uniref:Carbohydrate kinase PfkB domain-containing protein n=1 Tax=Blautia liquoris TaxID=2779518 RepID=A0A7M2RES8_9FIRM|nr:PfkB family carbohydrate kinase [Blautia liquoris]QOV18853.1 hypothetical protein INP51_12740 [Blautia liquoris]